MSDAAVWWLAVELIGLAAFPLTFAILRFLPDRGYSVTKVVGLVLMTYLLWLGGTLHLIPNRRLSILGVIALIAVVSAVLAWRNRSQIPDFLRSRWAHLIFVDALFTAVFLVCLFLRSLPLESLTGSNDNRFIIAFINSTIRTDYYPPGDPWLSGHDIAYYYFGFVTVAALTKVTGIASEVTFNLTIAIVPALAASGVFGIVYNSVIDRGNQRWVLACGVLAAIFLIFLSNIEALFELLSVHGVGTADFYKSLDVYGLEGTRHSTEWFPDDGGWTYRSINFVGNRFDTVFPFFDLLLPIGYPSGRNIAIPMLLLVIAAMLNIWRSDSSRFQTIRPSRADAVAVGFTSLALGALIAAHAWDFPTACMLILVTFTCRNYWLERRFNFAVVIRTVAYVAAIAILAGVLYLPYFLSASGQFGGVLLLPAEVASEPQHMLYMWLPLFWLGAGLAFFALRSFRLNDSRLWASVALPLLVLLSWAVYRVIDGSFGQLQEDVEVRGDAWISVAVLMALLALMVLALLNQVLTVPAERREPPLVFALSLASIAVLLILGIEFFYVDESTNSITLDMNTVLRVNFQGWLFLSLGGALGIYYIGRTWFSAGPRFRLAGGAWASVALAVVFAGMLFPVMIGFYYEDVVADLKWGRTLDGLNRLEGTQPDEYEGILYLTNNVDGTPVIMEAVTDSYQGGARVSAYTGLPTVLGWVTHEFWFRGTYEPWAHRREDVALAYRTPSPAVAASILSQYDVQYVFVGRLETQMYGYAGLSKFSYFMDTVFHKDEVTIYKIRTDENGAVLSP